MLCQEIVEVIALMALGPYPSRSKFWGIEVAKSYNFFCGRSFEI